jgi:hypothetical protein
VEVEVVAVAAGEARVTAGHAGVEVTHFWNRIWKQIKRELD